MATDSTTRCRSILLVDDDDFLRATLTRGLEFHGFKVESVGNGLEALKFLETSEPELVVTDIIMPDMEGIEMIIRIKQRRPNLRVIAISGGARSEPGTYLDLAKRMGATRTMAKPFSSSDLAQSINEVLAA